MSPRHLPSSGRSGTAGAEGGRLARTARRTALAAAVGVVAAAAAACGSSGSPVTVISDSAAAGGTGQPGTFGKAAAINGSTIEVQGTSGQTAVTFGSSTTFTDTVSATLADVTTGACVSVTEPRSAATGAPTGGLPTGAAPGGGGTAMPTQPTAITAGTVTIEAAATCTQRATAQPDRSASPRYRPTDRPTGTRPTGGFGGGSGLGGGFGGTTGTVSGVSGSTFTVQADRNGQTRPVTVTVTATTTYEKQVTADSSALKVGECIAATGTADSTGTIAATSIRITPATASGQCFSGGRTGGAPTGAPGGAPGDAPANGGADA